MNKLIKEELVKNINSLLGKMYKTFELEEYRWTIGEFSEEAAKDGFDDSSWKTRKQAVEYKRGQGVTWHRFTVSVPDSCMGLDLTGNLLRLAHLFFAPTKVYIDGVLKFSEYAWMDFKSPEVVLTENFKSGQKFLVAVRLDLRDESFWNTGFGMSIVPEPVDEALFEIAGFRDELIFVSGFSQADIVLPDIINEFEQVLENHEDVPTILQFINKARLKMEIFREQSKSYKVNLIGHAHIDMNWFWPMEDTIDVIKRDFTTMCNILDEFPNFTFSQSQCATYDIVKRDFPELFSRVKHHVERGNWDITASTWTEGDLNMSSGESIVRHILYSKAFAKDNFEKDPKIMWSPDTFGHSANIPQILRKSGIENYFFFRCGIGFDQWDVQDESPMRECRHTPVFTWEGLDGSRVLCVNMIYGGDFSTGKANLIANRMDDGFGIKDSVLIYGTGDHGGGPTLRDVKRIERIKEYPTTPDIKFSTTPLYYDTLRHTPNYESMLPTHKGELNPIFGGCYTTHGDIKNSNRQCENRLYTCEAVCSIANLFGMEFPLSKIEEAWHSALFNQFHDIFDGSAVPSSYQYSNDIAKKSLETAKMLIDNSMDIIGKSMKAKEKSISVLCINPTGWDKKTSFSIPKPVWEMNYSVTGDNENNIICQNTAEEIYVSGIDVPATGGIVLHLQEDRSNEYKGILNETKDYYEVHTPYYRLEIKKSSGEVITLFDKERQKFVVSKAISCWRNKNGAFNTLSVHMEEPTHMSSWHIGEIQSVTNLIAGAKSSIIADGPIVTILRFEHQFQNSDIIQDIHIYQDRKVIDFVTSVNWQEYGDFDRCAPMLRVSFSPDISTDSAKAEIPFGSIDRPSKNWEMPTLRWVAIENKEIGFALLNDSKHGYKVSGNVVELALIRSGWLPDRKSDVGQHKFTYSMVLFDSGEAEKAVKESAFLNCPVVSKQINPEGSNTLIPSLIVPDQENIVVSAIKKSQDERGIIIRIYESMGRSGKINFKTSLNFKEIYETDLLEQELSVPVEIIYEGFSLEIKPFDIRTILLILNEEVN